MKIVQLSKGLLLGMALLLATSALASNKASVAFTDSVTINGTQLPAGDYSLKWEGSGDNVQLSVLKGSHVMVTTPARLVDLKESANNTSTIVTNNPDGSRSVTEIRFSGKKYALDLGNQTASMDNPSK